MQGKSLSYFPRTTRLIFPQAWKQLKKLLRVADTPA